MTLEDARKRAEEARAEEARAGRAELKRRAEEVRTERAELERRAKEARARAEPARRRVSREWRKGNGVRLVRIVCDECGNREIGGVRQFGKTLALGTKSHITNDYETLAHFVRRGAPVEVESGYGDCDEHGCKNPAAVTVSVRGYTWFSLCDDHNDENGAENSAASLRAEARDPRYEQRVPADDSVHVVLLDASDRQAEPGPWYDWPTANCRRHGDLVVHPHDLWRAIARARKQRKLAVVRVRVAHR